jgi:hypothetical protein
MKIRSEERAMKELVCSSREVFIDESIIVDTNAMKLSITAFRITTFRFQHNGTNY